MVIKMDITEQYRPQSRDEFVGNADILEEVVENISNGIHVLVTGGTGWGKTSMAHVVANELDLSLVSYTPTDVRNTDFLKSLLEETKRTSLMGDNLYLIESIDTITDTDTVDIKDPLSKLLKNSERPLFFTADDAYRTPYVVKKYCRFYKMKPPGLGGIARRIKSIAQKEGIPIGKINFKKVTPDVRSSIIASMDGSVPYEERANDFERVTDIFKTQTIHDIHPAWILDNIPNFYHGIDVYNAYRILRYAIELNDPFIYSCLPKTRRGKANYPYYLRRK